VAARDVAAENEIYLGGTWFPTTGPIRAANITVIPNPIVLGDTSRQSETQIVSQFIQPDAASGMGVYRANARVEFDRSWVSEAETRYSRQITLPPRVTDLGCPAGETAPPSFIVDYMGVTYVTFGLRVYTLIGTTWTLEHTLPALPTSMISYRDRLWISHESAGMSWKEGPIAGDGIGTTPGSWQLVPENSASLLYVRSESMFRWFKTWVTSSGALGVPFWLTKFTQVPYQPDAMIGGSPSPWAVNIQSGLPLDIFAILPFSGSVASREVYFVGTDGVYADGGLASLFATRVTYQRLVPGRYGRTACIWNDDLIVPTGELGLLAARIGTLAYRPIGLDQEDGLPGSRWGVIDRVVTGTGCFYALVTHLGRNDTVPRDLSVFAYDGHWHYVAGLASGLMTTTGTSVQGQCMTLLADGLYVGHTRADGTPAVKRIDERFQSVNPKQIGVDPAQTRFNYAEGPVTHTSPWYDFGSELQSKLLLKLQVQCEATPTETIEVQYAVDLDETRWVSLGTITANGLHTLAFNGPRGRQVRTVQLRYILRRQAGAANDYKRPLVDYAILEYMRLLPASWGFAVEVDLSRTYKGKTPTELLDRLMALSDPSQTGELVEFAYKDDQGEVAQTHYAKISRLTGQEWSGRKLRGVASYLVSVMVPYAQSDSV